MLGRGNTTKPIRRSNRTQGRIKMLVLSRKVGEKLVIDGNITVEVVKVKGKSQLASKHLPMSRFCVAS